MAAVKDEVYYGAVKISSKYVLIKVTVKESTSTFGDDLIPEFASIADLKADVTRGLGAGAKIAIHYKWDDGDNPSSGTSKTNGWYYSNAALADGWITTKHAAINVKPNQDIIVEYDGTKGFKPIEVKDTSKAFT